METFALDVDPDLARDDILNAPAGLAALVAAGSQSQTALATTVVAPAPARKRGRPRDPEADGRILAAAAELILVHGFDNMTVDDVASRAKVGKATVYRRWARKDDLALAAMQQLYSTQMPVPDCGNLREDLRQSYLGALAFANSPEGAAYFRMSIGESMRDQRITALYRDAVEGAESASREIFERAIARGEIRSGPAIGYAIEWLAGILTIRTVIDRRPLAVEEIDAMVDFTLHGLGAR
ncbi:MAG: transcriptional regulator, TetR family [Marmoricola sp.]|nr:transcriptional regulator, TetR family [Marmoricola sp.]